MSKAPGGLRFVFKEDGGRNRWFDNDGADFVVPLPQAALSSSLDLAPGGRVGVPLEKKTSETLEAAQMALGGAAAATFGVGRKTSTPTPRSSSSSRPPRTGCRRGDPSLGTGDGGGEGLARGRRHLHEGAATHRAGGAGA